MSSNTATWKAYVRARLEAATVKGWKDSDDWYHDCRVGVNMTEQGEFDEEASAFIAHAPTDLALALEIIETYEAALEKIEDPRKAGGRWRMNTCPKCHRDPFKGWDGDDHYNKGAYDLEKVTKIDCGSCGEKIFMKPFESIDHDFAESEDDL